MHSVTHLFPWPKSQMPPPTITARRGFPGMALDTNLRGGTGLAAMGGADFRAWAASLLHGGGATGADAMVM